VPCSPSPPPPGTRSWPRSAPSPTSAHSRAAPSLGLSRHPLTTMRGWRNHALPGRTGGRTGAAGRPARANWRGPGHASERTGTHQPANRARQRADWETPASGLGRAAMGLGRAASGPGRAPARSRGAGEVGPVRTSQEVGARRRGGQAADGQVAYRGSAGRYLRTSPVPHVTQAAFAPVASRSWRADTSQSPLQGPMLTVMPRFAA
jgi:hypothetical protein